MKVPVIYDEVIEKYALEDENELTEIKKICSILSDLGYDAFRLPLNIKNIDLNIFEDIKPLFAFNLVDTLDEKSRFSSLPVSLLDELNIPYTGCSSDVIYLTSNKVFVKDILEKWDISTPPWFLMKDILFGIVPFSPPYIVKNIWEDASSELNENSVIYEKEILERVIKKLYIEKGDNYFIADYIDGREFNISLLAGENGPEILPPMEIDFSNYPPGKPRINDYTAKWNKNSFEYKNTPQKFEFSEKDRALLNQMRDMAEKCWNIFSLSGYSRIDFRVDRNNVPFILEINTNPYLGEDGSFMASARKASLTFEKVVERIIAVPLKKIEYVRKLKE